MEREVAIDQDEVLVRLVAEAEHGETIVLTREGVKVATIVPATTRHNFDRAEARRAMNRILELSKGLSLGDTSIKDLINEGRKY